MHTRRPHNKSRNGCTTCKRRRTKCDEQTPRCSPCTIKDLCCEYVSLPKNRPSATRNSSALSSSSSRSSNLGNPTYVSAGVQTQDTRWSDSRRMELELLHQWSSVTYMNLCGCISSQWPIWQFVVPQLAFEHDFLMQGLLAFSALELATFSKDDLVSKKYLKAAIKLYYTASSQFQHELYHLSSPSKHPPLVALATLVLAIEAGMSRLEIPGVEQRSSLSHILTYFKLMRGVISVVAATPGAGHHRLVTSNTPQFSDLPRYDIDQNSQVALDRLTQLNEDIHLNDPRIIPKTGDAFEGDLEMTYYTANGRALIWLKECFARCVSDESDDLSVVWPFVAGRAFETALTARAPVALLVLLHWAIFLDRVGRRTWYFEGLAVGLIKELSTELASQSDPRFAESVAWVREQVGLDKMLPMKYCALSQIELQASR